jgi:Ala-tRNA(Pro) deacylase
MVDCRQRLETQFREKGVEYQVHHHPVAYTAQETAALDNVPGRTFAKPVIVVAAEKMAIAVLAAPDRLDLDLAAAACGAASARLAEEKEFASSFPDCEVGAMPPLGGMYGLPTYVDTQLTEQEKIVFAAGTHMDTITMNWTDYESIAEPIVVDLRVAPKSREALAL